MKLEKLHQAVETFNRQDAEFDANSARKVAECMAAISETTATLLSSIEKMLSDYRGFVDRVRVEFTEYMSIEASKIADASTEVKAVFDEFSSYSEKVDAESHRLVAEALAFAKRSDLAPDIPGEMQIEVRDVAPVA